MFQAAKLEGQNHLSSWTPDMEQRDLESVLLGFGLSLLISSLCPYRFFWNGNMYSVLLHVGSIKFRVLVWFGLVFAGVTIKTLSESQKRLWTGFVCLF